VTAFAASGLLWVAWSFSWAAAAFWSRRTTARAPRAERLLDVIPTVAGAAMLLYGARTRMVFGETPLTLWRLPGAAEWGLVGVEALGFAFAWWARLTLGDLWSGAVTRKEGHVVVERGPYRLVRHPIYTGIIAAAVALALMIGAPSGLLGAALIAAGFSIKARLEERFLSAELGEDAYADYRRRTPMLIPLWPMRP
jgi:protein-S-isoprenylcysteine O-methyltransferase Ste14